MPISPSTPASSPAPRDGSQFVRQDRPAHGLQPANLILPGRWGYPRLPQEGFQSFFFIVIVVVLLNGIIVVSPLTASDAEYEHEAIGYATATPDNVVSRLQQRLAAGNASLEYDARMGWLPSVLRELSIDRSSQMLVFSKTSLQRSRIAPETPRALYFNDEVYVGYCHNGDVIEITAADPQLGAVFYTVDQNEPAVPTLARQGDNCLICHASSAHTGGVPGHVVRSVFADAGGFPLLSEGSFRIDQKSPLKERWGGWYVTGTHGDAEHLGNLIIRDKTRPATIPTENLNLVDITGRLDTSAYLTPHSDIVALMVMEHQTAMHNKLTSANFATKRALWDEKVLDDAFGDGADEHRESTIRRINNAAEPVVEYLLFSGEAELSGRISGTSGYAESFAAEGPRDAKGRSLRDLDLEIRLFKYPCSYLIYSPAFDGLPGPVRDRVYLRLHEILTGKDKSEKFTHLTPSDRRAILDILLATKQGLPEYWRQSGGEVTTADAGGS